MVSVRDTYFILFLAVLYLAVNPAAFARTKKVEAKAICEDCQSVPSPELAPTKNFAEQMVAATSCGPAEKGMASYYGKKDGFAGKKTASGEFLVSHKLTAAHRTLPFGTVVKIRSLSTNKVVMVEVNDRGPSLPDRMIDLNFGAAKKIGLDKLGVDEVEMQVCGSN